MEGYFKGIECWAYSKDSLAEKGEATFNALKDKHPPVHPDYQFHHLPVWLPIQLLCQRLM